MRCNDCKGLSGISNPNWKGGRIIHKGYIYLKQSDGRYILEHRLIVEQWLGRQLNGKELVHHKDGNTLNNAIANLAVFPCKNEHARLHAYEQFRLHPIPETYS